MTNFTITKFKNTISVPVEVRPDNPDNGEVVTLEPGMESGNLTWIGSNESPVSFSVYYDGMSSGNGCTISLNKAQSFVKVGWEIGKHDASSPSQFAFQVNLHRSDVPASSDGIVIIGTIDIEP